MTNPPQPEGAVERASTPSLPTHRPGEVLRRVLWALLFATLPVTSFPFFPQDLGGRTLVRPLAVYPLAALLALVTLSRLLRRPLPRTLLPLMAFVLVSLASAGAAAAFGTEAWLGVSVAARLLRNLITLGIGGAFYLTILLYPKSLEDLKSALRWTYAGFSLALLWGSLQAVYIVRFYPPYFRLLNTIQRFISTRKLFDDRVSGMTYEPKWFAEQICFLLIPWLLGSVLTGQSLFSWRWRPVILSAAKDRPITVEHLLLVWSAGVLIFTFSRSGLLILGVLVGLATLLAYSGRLRGSTHPAAGEQHRGKSRTRRLVEAGMLLTGLVTIVFAAGSQNRYFSRFWNYWIDDERPLNKTFLEYVAFQQRFIYWETAFYMYEAHPLLGVGPGNYALYFGDLLPERPYNRLPEIGRQITPVEGRDRFITPKSLPARLLAETGLAGAFTFLAFIMAVSGCALYLWLSPSLEVRYWGIAGTLALVVFAISSLTVDSFAIPNMWVVFGLITAAAHLPATNDLSLK